jgi:hypothetical protein
MGVPGQPELQRETLSQKKQNKKAKSKKYISKQPKSVQTKSFVSLTRILHIVKMLFSA